MKIESNISSSDYTTARGCDHRHFPFSPPWWQSCLSLPDELDKVLLGREGALLMDYERDGPGHRGFRAVIEPGLGENTAFVDQHLADLSIPIVATTLADETLILDTQTFCVTPPDDQFGLSSTLVREGGEEGFSGWDGPQVPRTRRKFARACMAAAPEFSTVAWGPGGREIVYHWHTAPGSAAEVVLGFAEGEYDHAGKRVLVIEVEGAEARTLDPLAAFGFDTPGLVRIHAVDTNRDGRIRIAVRAASDSPDTTAFLAALWIFQEASPGDAEIVAGVSAPVAFADCGTTYEQRRQILMKLDITNQGDKAVICQPVLTVRSGERVQLMRGALSIGSRTRLLTHGGIQTLARDGESWRAALPEVEIAPSSRHTIILTVNRHGYESGPVAPDAFEAKRAAAVRYWRSLPLPLGQVQVPDSRIQALLDSSIRNIYQARDQFHGLPAFHVGPTCYRQLWIIDGAFLLELVTMLGRYEEARAGIQYMLSYQLEDGSFQLKHRYWKEAGIVLWAVVRHARLSQDKAWLRSYWPQLEKAVAFIQSLRHQEAAGDPAALEYGLAPWGDCDGGYSNYAECQRFPEYSNPYWLMIGLKTIAEAAAWIGEKEQAEAWGAEYRSYRATFDKAAARDMRTDSHGNRYLPILMRGEIEPQRGQWPFCHAVYPGGLFEPGDPFVTDMMAMLKAVEVEGMTLDTGWMPGGLWTYFNAFVAHAYLWNGNGRAAYEALEAFADHASPMLVWREEQKPAGQGNDEVGDMPHNWASAEFVRLTLHLMMLERNDELHLLAGVPPEWLYDGAQLEAREIATVFGTISLRVEVENDMLHVEATAAGSDCTAFVVHLDGWQPDADPIRLPANQPVQLKIPKDHSGC